MDGVWYIQYDDIEQPRENDAYVLRNKQFRLAAQRQTEAELEFQKKWPEIRRERAKREKASGGNMIHHGGDSQPRLLCEIPTPKVVEEKTE